MSAAQIDVDDADNSIVYAGSWSAVSHQGAHDDSLHQTTTAGSSWTFSYIVLRQKSGCTYLSNNDGWQSGDIMSVVCNDQFQNGLSVTAEADGPSDANANHVVTLTNLGGSRNAPLIFDFIEYTSFAGQSSTSTVQANPPSTGAGSATASLTPTSSSPPASASLITGSKDSIIHTVGPEAVNVTSTQVTTINGVVTPITVVTTSTNVLAGSNPSSTSVTGSVEKSQTRLVGPIVGAVLGILLLSLLMLLLRSFLLRRSHSGPLASKPAEYVEPFHLDQNSFPEGTSSSANRPPTSTIQPSSTSRQPGAVLEDEKDKSRSPYQTRTPAHQIPGSQSDLLSPSSPPSNQQPVPTQPSSLALSYTSPAYAWESSACRPHYRFRIPSLEISLDVPPSYDSVQNAGLKPPSGPGDLITDTD